MSTQRTHRRLCTRPHVACCAGHDLFNSEFALVSRCPGSPSTLPRAPVFLNHAYFIPGGELGGSRDIPGLSLLINKRNKVAASPDGFKITKRSTHRRWAWGLGALLTRLPGAVLSWYLDPPPGAGKPGTHTLPGCNLSHLPAYRPALGTPASRVAHSAAQVAQLPRSKVNCTLLCAVLCREARRPSQISTTV